MAINTTQSVKKASIAMAQECEKTKKDMKNLAKKLYGDAEVKMEKVVLPNLHGVKDDVLYAQVNGVVFHFQRGQTVEMPVAVAEVLRNAGKI